MTVEALQAATRLKVAQRFTLGVNRYDVIVEPTGQPVAFAQQKRIALREEVRFYADESRRQELFSFKARQALDLAATYEVRAAEGTPIGAFSKQFGASLLRTTFGVRQADGWHGTGQERSLAVALLRRFVTDLPLPVHFEVTGPEGAPAFSVERSFSLRDSYAVTIPDPRIDRRLVVAMAVGLDALLGR